MAYWCNKCNSSFPTRRRKWTHIARIHRHPKPKAPKSAIVRHLLLNARPCNEAGNFLPDNAPPPPPPPLPHNKFFPFQDRTDFEFVEVEFEKAQNSRDEVRSLLDVWKARVILEAKGGTAPFDNYDELSTVIDKIPYGDANWTTFRIRYTGPKDNNSPAWMHQAFVIHTRDVCTVMKNILGTAEFDGKFDYVAFKEFANNTRRYSNFMSGQWATMESDKIAQDPATHGSMLAPIILGADKTTVSVATGQTDFHPLYASIGNVHNTVRRAHIDALVPIAFLAIPQGSPADKRSAVFRIFKKQLYHASLSRILQPLRPAMTTPEVTRCPDGHFRKIIYSIGCFIADYPEQVYLAGIVQGWCPKCLAFPTSLDDKDALRFRQLDEHLRHAFADDEDLLWDAFGIAPGVIPFTEDFPRADIHQLLSPDLLHQLIKGTFKDHLVEWVFAYINDRDNYSATRATEIMAEVDARLAAVPSFPGLRRFLQGRAFKQWTGDDSKGLMAIFIPAVEEHIPDRMTQCLTAFLDFCFVARRDSHDSDSLREMEQHLDRFHDLRDVFKTENIRSDFALPRQHALVHYITSIRLFGSPNGLCSSITESKHIRAVKETWRRSNRRDSLPQMLTSITRMSKISAARSVFGSHGLLKHDLVTWARLECLKRDGGLDDVEVDPEDDVPDGNARHRDRGPAPEVEDVDGDYEPASVQLAVEEVCSRRIGQLPLDNRCKAALPALVRRFLFSQQNPDRADWETVDLDECPTFGRNVKLFESARALYYAPSELCGPGGMHSERIRSATDWYHEGERRDTILVQNGDEDDTMGGMLVARVMAFLSFNHDDITYPTALVEWFRPRGDTPDTVNGMWVLEPIRILNGPEAGMRELGIVHMDCVVRACHLIPVYRGIHLPRPWNRIDTLKAFNAYYLNKYADYHTHECYPSS